MDIIKAPMFAESTPELTEGGYLLPEGPATCEILDAELRTAKTGTPQVMVSLKIVNSDPEKKGIDFWTVPTTEHIAKHGADSMVCKLWKAVHKFCPDALDAEGVNNAKALKGLRFTCNIAHEPDQQKRMQNRFKFVFPIGKAAPEVPAGPGTFAG